jgi:hypothetical protein
MIIIMANLKNDVKFDSGGECKGVCICICMYMYMYVYVYVLLNMILQQHSTLKTLTRINNCSVRVNKTSD